MDAWRELARLPRRLWILAAATLINRMGTMALPFLTLYLVRALRFSPSQAARVLALYGAAAFVAGPLSGRLADRWGTARVMVGTLTLSGLGMLAFPWAGGYAAICGLTLFWAFASEAFRPVALAAVSESAPPAQRKQAYALNRLAVNLGMSVGPALGGFLAAVSFRSIWLVDAVTTLLAALVLALYLPQAASLAPSASKIPSARGLSDRRLLFFLAAVVLNAMVFFQHESVLSLCLVRDLGYRETFYGLLFTINTLMIVALEIPLNHATACWPHRRSLGLGAALFAFGYGLYAFAARPWLAVVATMVWTFGEMVLMPSMSAYVGEIAPADRLGEYMGLYTMAFSLAFIAGPWAGLLLYERWGGAILWGLCLVVGLLAAALFNAIAGAPETCAQPVEPLSAS